MDESIALMFVMIIFCLSICGARILDQLDRWYFLQKYCPKTKSKELQICTICYDDICERDSARMVKRCSHMYHDVCLRLWMQDKITCICPNCGIDIYHFGD